LNEEQKFISFVGTALVHAKPEALKKQAKAKKIFFIIP